jgi:hypothetical protein
MKGLLCAYVFRQLAAFHDGELSVEQQIAVESHLQECSRCAAEVQRLQSISDALRCQAAGLAQESFADIEGLRAGVISRMKAEREESLPSQIGRLFEDLHLVYAVLGAAGATLACLVVMFGMMHFGAQERPDSLAALVEVLAAPAASSNIVSEGRLVTTIQPGALRDDGPGSDAVFALSSVVTDQGRLRTLDSGQVDSQSLSGEQAREQILNLMDTIIETQFQPNLIDGLPLSATAWRFHVTVHPRRSRVSASAAPHVTKQSAGAALRDGQLTTAVA